MRPYFPGEIAGERAVTIAQTKQRCRIEVLIGLRAAKSAGAFQERRSPMPILVL